MAMLYHGRHSRAHLRSSSVSSECLRRGSLRALQCTPCEQRSMIRTPAEKVNREPLALPLRFVSRTHKNAPANEPGHKDDRGHDMNSALCRRSVRGANRSAAAEAQVDAEEDLVEVTPHICR